MDNKITAKLLIAYGFINQNAATTNYELRIHDSKLGCKQYIEVGLVNKHIRLLNRHPAHDVSCVYECPHYTIAALKSFYKGLTGDELKMTIQPGNVVVRNGDYYLVLSNVEAHGNIEVDCHVFSLNNNRVAVKSMLSMEVVFSTLKDYYQDLLVEDSDADYHM